MDTIEVKFIDRIRIVFLYTSPAIFACAFLLNLYHARLDDIGDNIQTTKCDMIFNSENEDAENDIFEGISRNHKICTYKEQFAERHDFEHWLSKEKIVLSTNKDTKINSQNASKQQVTASCTDKSFECFKAKMSKDIDDKLLDIFIYNGLTIITIVLLPYLLLGDLLAHSNRIKLTIKQRVFHSSQNWWLKFLVAAIMAFGWIYIINPSGRGASTYFQFFIKAGLKTENTLPIYIQAEIMVPVLAGLFGWYLHMMGYIFKKLIHHDVVSTRVYNLLFRKFIITYGIALLISNAGLIEDQNHAAFFMFLFGLFPLSGMSILVEAMTKFGGGEKQLTGSLSQLPGISRWQILRLEEEGVDSMATLANISHSTIRENLQFIEKLSFFWMDIAQLYTIVGHDAYLNIKNHCFTASEFILKAEDEEFARIVTEIEGVSDTKEVARLLTSTFENRRMIEAS